MTAKVTQVCLILTKDLNGNLSWKNLTCMRKISSLKWHNHIIAATCRSAVSPPPLEGGVIDFLL